MKLTFKEFNVTPHNEHYEGAYSKKFLAWRRLGAIEKADNIQVVIGDRKVNSVLEVGCGSGAVLAELARRGIGNAHEGVDVVDPDSHRDVSAQELKLQKYDGNNLPYQNKSIDFVFASHVVEHILEPRRFIHDIVRVAKKLIYIEVPCELHLITNRKSLQKSLDIGHINAYTPESFLLLLQTSGLKVLEFEIFDHSIGVYCFFGSKMRGFAKMVVRRSLLQVNPYFASRIFTYHCGALVTPID